MKDLEKIFKESLANHEVPYDASAWTALNQKMTPAKPFYKKPWFYGTVAIVAGVVTGATLLLNGNSVNSNIKPKEIVQINSDKHVEKEYPKSKENNVSNDANTNDETQIEVVQSDENNPYLVSNSEPKNPVDVNGKPSNTPNDLVVIDSPIEEKKVEDGDKSKFEKLPVVLNPNFTLLTEKVCLGETVDIQFDSQNEVSYFFNFEGRKYFPVDGKLTIRPTNSGDEVVELVAVSDDSGQRKSIQKVIHVEEVNNPNIAISEPSYNNGLWIYKFESDNENAIWTIDGKSIASPSTAEHVFFESGTVEVATEVKSENGCSQKFSKELFVPAEKTKIRAQELLVLNRNETFMPKDLQNMINPEFDLVIRDQRGQQIFKTNDLSRPWDGTSSITGMKLPVGQSVTWELKIKNNKFVKNHIYKGIVSIVNH